MILGVFGMINTCLLKRAIQKRLSITFNLTEYNSYGQDELKYAFYTLVTLFDYFNMMNCLVEYNGKMEYC